MKISETASRKGFVSGLLLPLLTFSLYILLFFLLAKPLMGWLVLGRADEKGLLSALRFDGDNATYHYLLGRYYQLNLADPDITTAIDQYSRSLVINPLQAGAWLDLSKAYQLAGRDGEAEYALVRAVRLSPNNPEVAWEAGMFWLLKGMPERAVADFRRYILLDPGQQLKVYDLCWKLRLDNSYLLANLIPGTPEYRRGYLLYLMKTKRTEAAMEVWPLIDKSTFDSNLFIPYVNYLIRTGRYEEAGAAWDEILENMEREDDDDSFSLVRNPGFESKILNGGFDWIIAETEGVDVFLDHEIRMSGRSSLGIRFDGKRNPGITIARQTVRVEPGEYYNLRGYIKTDSITTTNGIIMTVRGHKDCRGLNVASAAVTGTNLWKEISLNFQTPEECGAVIVKIIRKRSSKFDNRIEGTAWIDGITLRKQADRPISNSEKL